MSENLILFFYWVQIRAVLTRIRTANGNPKDDRRVRHRSAPLFITKVSQNINPTFETETIEYTKYSTCFALIMILCSTFTFNFSQKKTLNRVKENGREEDCVQT